ncbi:MAG: class I SAM-dependent methyltransferase [Candidatus Aureabacteria bacterium]|nr:class I SAM-dependent methyltransferase [Candidatus Auribacterota bacterium]
MKKNTPWLSYNDLAWTEAILCRPEDYHDEVWPLCRAIFKHGGLKPKTLLHLGCGAGVYDHCFKKHFEVTGVDLSKPMLNVAARLNPQVTYIHGDMRLIRLNRKFDFVAIPDSIGYMTTLKDLRKAVHTARLHLNPGGILLIVAHMRDNFKENNFVYTGGNREFKIVVFENNFIVNRTQYEAAVVYLIRHKKKLKIYTDIHTIGLFDSKTWDILLKEKGFNVKKIKAGSNYERFMLRDGKYPQVILICKNRDHGGKKSYES